MAGNNDKVKALQDAYPNENLDTSDVQRNTAYNSYQSRHYDASGQLIDDTVALAQQNNLPVSTGIPVASASLSPIAPAVIDRDSRRIRDIKHIQEALELYFDAHPTIGYPKDLTALVPKYLSVLPLDPSTGVIYAYATDVAHVPSVHDIVSATLEDPQNVALQNDADGMDLGINCDDPVYCTGG